MIIVGGIYGERCTNPKTPLSIFGSGLRAAIALSGCAPNVRLVGACSDFEEPYVRAQSINFGVSTDLVNRSRPIQFTYETPLSAPSISGLGTASEGISAEGEVILAFGMIEARPEIKGARVVVDPQTPSIADLGESVKVTAEALAIVGNETEIRGLARDLEQIEECARQTREQYEAEVVVVKRGALGALVVTEGDVQRVGPFATRRVWPIGSGDVFSGVFAWAWGEKRVEPIEASRLASRATASWCTNGPHRVLNAEGQVIAPGVDVEKKPNAVSIYLAGPFFNLPQRWLINLVRESLTNLGAEVFSPFHDVGVGPADRVVEADLDGLRRSNGVLALLDGADAGTMFEVGYAARAGIPVVGFAENPDADDLKMAKGAVAHFVNDIPTAVYQSIWAALD